MIEIGDIVEDVTPGRLTGDYSDFGAVVKFRDGKTDIGCFWFDTIEEAKEHFDKNGLSDEALNNRHCLFLPTKNAIILIKQYYCDEDKRV